MNDPWDVPPIPTSADENANDTFAGVGMVMSEWEGIEVQLSRIYSCFLMDPDGESMRQYGNGRIFRERLDALELAAERFFHAYHDQEIEGLFHRLTIAVLGFSNRRNDVAHGIVMPIHIFTFFKERAGELKPRTAYWALMPPYHTLRKHDDQGLPLYVYTSKELRVLKECLSATFAELMELREKLRQIVWNLEQRKP